MEVMAGLRSLSLISGLFLFISGCGGADTASQIEEVAQCETNCTDSTLSFDGQLLNLRDSSSFDNNSNNASIEVNVYQDEASGNFVFDSKTQNIADESAVIQAVTTQLHFGIDFYPFIGTVYSLADAAMVYNYTNNSIPFIWYLEFNIETANGDVFEGSAETGKTIAARTFLADEYNGNKVSNFEFTLLESTVINGMADLKYTISFNFEGSSGYLHHYEQTISIQNSEALASFIPFQNN
jgi:hypothetical protein